MANVQDDMVVTLEYTLRLADQQVIDTSEGREPLQYIHGRGQLIAGLERELTGMAEGDQRDITVAPEDAYGLDDPDLIDTLPRAAFPPEVAVGDAYQMQTDSGQRLMVYIEEVGDQEVRVNLNHPLAGETLHFHVRIAGVRKATEEELAGCDCGCGCASCDDACAHDGCGCGEGDCACSN